MFVQKDEIQVEERETDLLIIGGGTAGCMAAVEARKQDADLDVLIVDKAHIERSGCLAAGMNAINAYISPGETPESFVKYVRKDAMGLLREDLVLSMAKRLNEVVRRVESWGLPIKKAEDGGYEQRGRWNIKINGEALKPILADKVREKGTDVLNRVVITNYLRAGERVVGAVGFHVRSGKFYIIKAKATIIATGGAAGIYRPNNEGSAHHKIWYSPFNTGAGYAMGIRAGAEMTSFEMRFIALRIKDIVAPTGTLALAFGAEQVNAYGERFMQDKFAHLGAEGAPTPIRVYGPTREKKEGRGPVFMDTTHLSPKRIRELKSSYLNMYPDLVLFWEANEFDFSEEMIEIEGTEPYLVGGHAQAGYWIDTSRETTLEGLFAAGDVAGGVPYKFVSGCWSEGVIAAENAVNYIRNYRGQNVLLDGYIEREKAAVFSPLFRKQGITAREMEKRLQKIMDEYAGGVSRYYEMNERELKLAERKLDHLTGEVQFLRADNFHDLMSCREIIDRIEIARVLVQHLLYREETRWPAFQSRVDYPEKNDKEWLKFVNSKKSRGEIKIIEHPYDKII
ncbi:MAG: adenylyl-sulfate reductase subunit alpha [Halanaerobiaceae bacterium]